MRITLIFLFFLSAIAHSLAQVIVTDRPDQTESSSTIPKGTMQIESGILIGYSGSGMDAQREILAPSNLFRIGVTNGFELRIVNQIESIKNIASKRSISGASDLEVGLKLQLFQKEDVNTEIALLSHLILPSGAQFISPKLFGTINKLSIAHSLGDNLDLGYNVGYNNFGEGAGDLTYSIALGIGITDHLGFYIEPYGDLVEFKTHIANFDSGFTYLLKDNLQLDFSFGLGINQRMNYSALGVSWLIGQK